MDLPPKRSGSYSPQPTGAPYANPSGRSPYNSRFRSSGASTNTNHNPSIHLTSATTSQQNPYTSRQPQSDDPIGFTPTSRYGHAGDHSWLKGRLEYSQAKRQWKLRYIPIDGQADQYGGSVELSKTSLLSGFERGDYVEVNGRLTESTASDDYSPEYELTQIRRIER
jgi:hypothetical protein